MAKYLNSYTKLIKKVNGSISEFTSSCFMIIESGDDDDNRTSSMSNGVIYFHTINHKNDRN